MTEIHEQDVYIPRDTPELGFLEGIRETFKEKYSTKEDLKTRKVPYKKMRVYFAIQEVEDD